MRTYIKLIFAGLMIVAGSRFVAATNQSDPNNREKRLQKYRIKKALGEKVISWLSDANDSAAVECDKLADSLLAQAEPDVWSYYIAAQVAYLRGKPDKAILILEDVISKHPDKKSAVMAFPVRIVARFWIATIAKQSGDITKAENAYKAILENLKNLKGLRGKEGLTMICNLYLAEIESLHLKRNDLALTRLEAIERIKKPAGHWGIQYELYKGWAAYQHTRIFKGRSQAAQELGSYPEHAPSLVATQLKLVGIIDVPLAGCCGRDKRADLIGKTFFDRAIQSTTSSIDRSLVRLFYGYVYEANKNFGEAERHYSALLEEDSYLSPMAGLCLAHCKEAQGKTAEAESVLEQVRAKYPGYDSAVTELKESWNKSKNN